MTIRFYHCRNFACLVRDEAEKQAVIEAVRAKQEAEEAEAKRKKYEIVDKIRHEMQVKDAQEKESLVDSYARQAQQEFLTVSIKQLKQSGNYSCPPKYLNQRDTALDVPIECIRKLCDAMDTDFDDRVSLQELKDYIRNKEMPFEEGVEELIFEDAIKGRGFTNEEQRIRPLSHDEVATAVRGRHRWNTRTKEWEVAYRPFRNYWIVLLLTV